MQNVSIRLFKPSDRPEVRALCHRTGYMGEPATFFWRHEESFADIWTAYYTDQEPESLFVAVLDNQVVGYLSGCEDSRLTPSTTKAVVRSVVRHALLFRPGTAGFLWRELVNSVYQRGTPSVELDDPRWPSHLHINLAPEARRFGVGRSLMKAWFERLAQVGSPGCHLCTWFENTHAIRFFEHMGFEPHGEPQLDPGMRAPSGGRLHVQFMVRSTLSA